MELYKGRPENTGGREEREVRVYDLLDRGEQVSTLGPIIHNPQLVEELKQKGVRIVDSPDEVKNGETLVIRSHGVERSVTERAKELNVSRTAITKWELGATIPRTELLPKLSSLLGCRIDDMF